MRYCDSGIFFLRYFASFCSILGSNKYCRPSLPQFSEPFPVSDSFENSSNSKITELQLDLH